ncbi:hypothetical protein LRY60_06185 [Candidatus Woesebacteria bacterium]|nr:hypothetical protein [Candidatus Woesebacteria bacterium]
MRQCHSFGSCAWWYESRAKQFPRSVWWKMLLAAFLGTAILSPLVGLTIGISGILMRNIFYPVLETMSANAINTFVESRYRATTLSAFAMLTSIPYVFGAAVVGMAIDRWNAALVTMVLGLGFGVVYVWKNGRESFGS